jgi:hypothetical protein
VSAKIPKELKKLLKPALWQLQESAVSAKKAIFSIL